MKALKVLLFSLFFASCSSSDDSGVAIDRSLLYAKWNKNNYCAVQNNLELSENGTYVEFYSGNSCDDNYHDTYKSAGQFTLQGNKIAFNEQSSEVVIEGENAVPQTPDFTVQKDLFILKLTATQLEIGSKRSGTDFYDVVTYTKAVD